MIFHMQLIGRTSPRTLIVQVRFLVLPHSGRQSGLALVLAPGTPEIQQSIHQKARRHYVQNLRLPIERSVKWTRYRYTT